MYCLPAFKLNDKHQNTTEHKSNDGSNQIKHTSIKSNLIIVKLTDIFQVVFFSLFFLGGVLITFPESGLNSKETK